MYIGGLVAVLAFLLACGSVALASRAQHRPREDKITNLETQLSNSNIVIEQLTSKIEDIRRNISASVDGENDEINKLSLQVSDVYKSVDVIINATSNETFKTLNMSQSCSPVLLVGSCAIPNSLSHL